MPGSKKAVMVAFSLLVVEYLLYMGLIWYATADKDFIKPRMLSRWHKILCFIEAKVSSKRDWAYIAYQKAVEDSRL